MSFLTKIIGISIASIISQAATGQTCCTFPTFEKPTASYQISPRKFGANRSGSRLHAACDLYQTAKGQGVRSISPGRVIRDLYYFYQGTFAIELKHQDGTVARYGEITGQRPPGFNKNLPISGGQTIGYVGKVSSNCCEPMLHFERYKGTLTGPLTQPQANRYHRRADLIDATIDLLAWEEATFPPTSPPPTILMAPALKELKSIPTQIPTEQISLNNMLGTLLLMEKSGHNPDQLMSDLAKLDIATQLTKHSNPDTGEMALVQSMDLTGSAYHLHAQYFGQNDFLLQHISFEIKPGIKSLESLIQDIRARSPSLGAPDIQTPTFVQWQLSEGKILWIMVLDKEDLQSNPFYDYTVEDIGTMRIAIELDHE